MPGNVKPGASSDPDPDPAPYLFLTFEMKCQDQMKHYDPKRSYWVPDGSGGFIEGLLESDEGGKAVVKIGHEKRTFKSHEIAQVKIFIFF